MNTHDAAHGDHGYRHGDHGYRHGDHGDDGDHGSVVGARSLQQESAEGVDDRTLADWSFEQSSLFMVIYDIDARFWRVSAGGRAMIGLGEADVRGKRLTEALPDPTYEEFEAQLRRVAQTGQSMIYENHVRAPSEPREHAWSTSMSPIRDPTGRVLAVFAAAFDVSEQNWARQRLAVLNEAGARIGSTLDLVQTAQELADVAVPRIADFASIDLLDSVLRGDEPPPGPVSGAVALRRVAHQSIWSGVPEAVVELGAIDSYPPFSPPARCLIAERAVLSKADDPDFLRWTSGDPARDARVQETGFHSMIAVPLSARGTTLGVVVFIRHQRPEPFTDDDLVLVEELAGRAAVCVDNARRFTREHNTALALQHSLLPRRLPIQGAVEVASRYLPAETQVGIGGDWFDVIPLSGSRVAMVVGDVVGHGLHASATMGRLRVAVRTLADLDLAPDELLTRLDDLVTRLDTEDSGTTDDDTPAHIGATCLYAVYDPISGRCTLARAGHPLPIQVTPDGSVVFLDVPAGPPLGLGGIPFEATEVDLAEGSLLALYTDGLVESRDYDIDIGLRELSRVLAEPATSLEATCDKVLKTLLPDHPSDDVAFLLARTRTLGADQVASWDLPPDPALVASARTLTCSQLAAWGLEEASFTTELVVSELVTNAIRHAQPPIQLRLIRDSSLICEVSDASSTAPQLRRAQAFDEGGRGLMLVAQLTERWGSRATPTGKIIWCEQPLSVE